MNNLSKPHTLRLNPDAERKLNELLNTATPELIERLTKRDRAQRKGYRGHSGLKPQPKALMLRCAVEIGLYLIESELEVEALHTPGTDTP